MEAPTDHWIETATGLGATGVEPDVVLIRVNGRQLMVLSDALPGLRVEGKPQCHIVAIAKEQGEVAALWSRSPARMTACSRCWWHGR